MDMDAIHEQMHLMIELGDVEEDAIRGFESLIEKEQELTTDSAEFAWFHTGIAFAVASMIIEEEENDAEYPEEDEEEG